MNEGAPAPVRIVGAVLVRDGKMLLGRRSAHRRSFPGMWDVIGGHVEPGEDNVSALVRELREELGIEATQFVPFADFAFGDRIQMQVFRVDEWRGVPRLANDEHSELGWFDVVAAQSLPDLASPAYAGLFGKIGI